MTELHTQVNELKNHENKAVEKVTFKLSVRFYTYY